jgi:hypothetical protein
MPISFRPNATVWVWLDVDKDIDFATRPRFKCRVFTCAALDDWYDSLESLVKKNASAKQTAEFLMTYLVGWENFKTEFNSDELCRVLTLREMWELARSLPVKAGASEDDLGKSASPLLTVGAASAQDAPTVAKTSQASASPS